MPMFLKRFPLRNADPGAGGGGGAPAGGTPADWISGISDEGVRSWVTTKGFKDPAAVATSAWNLEKLIGVPQDRIVKLPGDDKPEAWNEVYTRLGRPENADGYKIPVPEGGNPEFAKTAAAWFHEAGLGQKQAEKLAGKWNEYMGQQAQAQQDALAAAGTEQAGKLKTEWGASHDANIAIAQKAAKAFGFNEQAIDALQQAMGYDGVMKMLHSIGSKIGEDNFVGGGGAPSGGASSPDAAKAEIALLRKDGDFTQRLLRGDAEAKTKWSRLHQQAFPGETILT